MYRVEHLHTSLGSHAVCSAPPRLRSFVVPLEANTHTQHAHATPRRRRHAHTHAHTYTHTQGQASRGDQDRWLPGTHTMLGPFRVAGMTDPYSSSLSEACPNPSVPERCPTANRCPQPPVLHCTSPACRHPSCRRPERRRASSARRSAAAVALASSPWSSAPHRGHLHDPAPAPSSRIGRARGPTLTPPALLLHAVARAQFCGGWGAAGPSGGAARPFRGAWPRLLWGLQSCPA